MLCYVTYTAAQPACTTPQQVNQSGGVQGYFSAHEWLNRGNGMHDYRFVNRQPADRDRHQRVGSAG